MIPTETSEVPDRQAGHAYPHAVVNTPLIELLQIQLLSELVQLNLKFLCGFAHVLSIIFLPIFTGCELRLI